MKSTFVCLLMVAATAMAMAFPTGTYLTPSGAFSYSTGSSPYYYGGWPTTGFWGYSTSGGAIPYTWALQPHHYTYSAPAAATPAATTYYHHAPWTYSIGIGAGAGAITANQYHAQDGIGGYSYGYASADGQAKVETKTLDGTVAGRFSYMDPTGKMIETRYTAGKDGFKAEGDHLPKSPEVPELPDSVKEAYAKAKEEFDEAANRKAPEAHVNHAILAAAPLTYIATAPAATVHHLPTTYVSSSTGGKSAYTYYTG